MIKLSKDDILHIAKLSRLELSSSEINKFKVQLSEILSYVEELKKINTKGIDPTSQTTNLENIFADDVVKPEYMLSVEEAISGSDKTVNNLFAVPMLLTQRSDK